MKAMGEQITPRGDTSVPTRTQVVRGTIKLGQLLKLANLAQTGGHARDLVTAGLVSVNGEIVTQRGRQLGDGDCVQLVNVDGDLPRDVVVVRVRDE